MSFSDVAEQAMSNNALRLLKSICRQMEFFHNIKRTETRFDFKLRRIGHLFSSIDT